MHKRFAFFVVFHLFDALYHACKRYCLSNFNRIDFPLAFSYLLNFKQCLAEKKILSFIRLYKRGFFEELFRIAVYILIRV